MDTADLTGQTFGDLTVVAIVPYRAEGIRPTMSQWRRWQCRCSCGLTIEPRGYDLLVIGQQRCNRCATTLRNRLNRDYVVRSENGRMTPEYRAWVDAKQRCSNTHWAKYHLWGGRGIRVCDAWWTDFAAFYAHVGPRPSPGHSLDRIDPNGHYEPGNVRCATIH